MLALLVAALCLGAVMPGQWRTERTIEVAASMPEVFFLIDDLQRWPEWTAWSEASDPSLQRRFAEGPTRGAGAAMAWSGDEVGEGRLAITESVPGRYVRYDLQLEQDGLVSHGEISLEQIVGGVRVTWRTEGELGWSPLVRLMGPWIEGAVGADFENGLAGLRRMAEGRRT